MVNPYYADDTVMLYHGDMREVLPALTLTADCIVTDPPYGETSLAWDRWPPEWPSIAAEKSASMWCFGSMRMFMQQRDEFFPWKLSQDVVWEKPTAGFNPGDRFNRVHEYALHWYRGPWGDLHKAPPRVTAAKRRAGDLITRRHKPAGVHGEMGATAQVSDGKAYQSSVIRAVVPRSTSTHPTEKPIGLLDPLIHYACPPDGLVLDPFAGSGSTAVAARLSGRRAVLVEGSERYCELIARRLAQDVLPIA